MLLRLVLYVDDSGATFPLDDPRVRLRSIQDLNAFLTDTLQRPPRDIFYWNFERSHYEPLTSLECLQKANSSGAPGSSVKDNASEAVACLWVETRQMRLDPLDPDVDVDEYAELRAHVLRWKDTAEVSYSLQTALRVIDPCAARLFDYVRRKELSDASGDVELLYYTNNSLSCGDVLQRGFSLADPTPETLFVFSSLLPDLGAPAGPRKVLLCEVAPGRAWLDDRAPGRPAAAPPAGCDSARHRATGGGGSAAVRLRVGRSHQALARYLLTVRPDPGPGPGPPLGPPLGSPSASASASASAFPSASASAFPSASAGPRGRGGGGRGRLGGPRRLSAPQCLAHPGTPLGIWCARCAVLVCPFCAAVGAHRGHRVEGADAVADDARRRVQSLCHELAMRLDHYRRVRTQLGAEQAQLRVRVRDATRVMEAEFADLRRTVEARRRVCVARAEAQAQCLDAALSEASCVVRKYEDAIAPLERAWTACGGASAAFLAEAPRLLRSGVRFARETHDEAMEAAVAAAKEARTREENVLHVNCMAVCRRLERLGSDEDDNEDDGEGRTYNGDDEFRMNGTATHSRNGAEDGGGSPLLLSTSANKSDNWRHLERLSTSPGVATPRRVRSSDKGFAYSTTVVKLRDGISSDTASAEGVTRENRRGTVQRRRLADLCKGYIWSVHDASQHFHHEQRRAVCSRPFTLVGLRWELCIRAAAVSKEKEAERETRDGKMDEPLGIFLYPVEHTQRMDFRIVLFSASVWAEWDVTGWALDFAGKGWGVYPLLSRSEMMKADCLACDDRVKVCVVPCSGLY